MLTPQQIAKIRQDAGAPAAPVSPSSTTGMSLSQKTAVAPQQTTPTNVNAEHATFPATGNESPLGIAAHTIGNIPSSAIGFGKSVIDFLNPLNTVKTAQNIGETINSIQQDKGGADVSALDVAKEAVAPGGDIRQGQAFKAVVPQFLQHIFQGDVTKAAATIENDPVGQLAPLIMVARGAAQKMGKGAEFDSAMSTIAKPVTATGKAAANAAGNVAAQTLGATTGTGASTIKAAAEGTPEFTQAMRGKISPEDVVNSAKGVVQNIKTNRSSAYIEDLKKVGEDQTSHDITSVVDEVPKQLKNFGVKVGENGELDFSRSSIANNGSARADIQGVYDTVKDWGKQRGDRTGIGLDTLKKQLGDFYSDSGQARAFVQAVKSKVDNILQTQVPGYKEMTGKYAKASGLLEDIKSATAIGGKANADTVFTKLVTAMKGDKEFRLEVLKEMEASGDPRLMDKIAGVNMQSLIPKGLIGRGVDVITAYQVLQGTFSAKFLPMLLATSPRVVGEFVRALGLGAQKTKSVLDAINKLPDDFDMSPVQSDKASMAPSAKQTANSVTKNSNDESIAPNTQKSIPPEGSVEQLIESNGGWQPGDRALFDRALLHKDAKTVQEMLPRVPKAYQESFSQDIQRILGTQSSAQAAPESALSFIKNNIGDQRGMIKNPLAKPKVSVQPADVANKIGGKDVPLIQDYVADPSLANLMKLQPILEPMGLLNMDISELQPFFEEVFLVRNSPDFGTSKFMQDANTGQMTGSKKN